jgi:hypothetical protein
MGWTFYNSSGQQLSTTAGVGKIGQVVSVTKQDTFSTSSAAFTDITGLTLDITPSATNSKILVQYALNGAQDHDANRAQYKLVRDSTDIFIGDPTGTSRTGVSGEFSAAHDSISDSTAAGLYLDSPSSTSAVTYKLQYRVGAGAGSVYINRTGPTWGDDATTSISASTIVLMEVLA